MAYLRILRHLTLTLTITQMLTLTLLALQYVLRHQAALTGLLAADLITMAEKRTLSHFDLCIMVKIFGYRDLLHYYTGALLPANSAGYAL